MRFPIIIAALAFALPCFGDDPNFNEPRPTATDTRNQLDAQAPIDDTDSRSARQDFGRDTDLRRSPSPDPAMLIARIEQLEQRIAILERHFATAQNRQFGRELVSPPTPEFGPTYRLDPTEQPLGNGDAQLNNPSARQTPKAQQIPQDRQRFNFNGQWFYIVPVDDLREADNPRTRQ